MTNQPPSTLSSRPNVSVSGGISGINVWTDYKRFLERTRNDKMRALVIVVICYLLFGASTVRAQSSDAPVASAAAIKEDINKTIQEAIDKNLKNTQEVLAASETLNRTVGYTGTISDIKQTVFTLTSPDATLQVSFDPITKIIKDGASLKPELISINDRAIVIGTITTPDIIQAKRIVIFKEEKPKYEKKSFYSPVVKVDAVKKTITLKVDNNNQVVALGKLIKFDLTKLTTNQSIFGIIMTNTTTGTVTLIQGKII